MHARIDQLLSARDGEPVDAAIATHLSSCDHCANELARLQRQRQSLRALPQFEAPDAWTKITESASHEPSRRISWLAAAAMVVFAAVLIVGNSLRNEPVETAATDNAPASPVQISEQELAALIEQSRTLETTLQQLPARGRVERAGTAATIDGLEQRIQWLDYYLSYASDGLNQSQASRLWQERVQLMDTLVKVRYANTVATTL